MWPPQNLFNVKPLGYLGIRNIWAEKVEKKVEEKLEEKQEADGIRHGKNNSNGMRNPIVIIVPKLPLGEVELEIAPGSARFRNQLSRRKSDIISLIELLRSR